MHTHTVEEGSKIRHAKELENRRLEAIKQRKLAELQRAGVPEKYLAELQNKKVGWHDSDHVDLEGHASAVTGKWVHAELSSLRWAWDDET